MGKDLYGADEFVMDSYRIREGKWAILEMTGKECIELDDSLLDEYQDQIHEDDVLQISLFQPKRRDIAEAVDSIGSRVGFRVVDGKIYLPDLPPIYVEGLTLEEARREIQDQYQKEIRDTEVFVTYKDRIAKKVEIAGLTHISSMPVDGKIRLFELLAKAQIPPDANLFMSYLLRENKVVGVDMNRLMKEGDMSQNIVMHGGDKLYIAEPSAASLMVMGEVGRERVISLPAGYMPLRKAIAEAGGIPYTGDKSYIQIIRGNIVNPKIYTLSWEHVIHLPNDSLLLMPGDIVYVAAKPITEWNRFISQLLPSFSGFETVSGVIPP